jgi:hypothetical protein
MSKERVRRSISWAFVALRVIVFVVVIIYLISNSFFGDPFLWIFLLLIAAATHTYIVIKGERPLDVVLRAISTRLRRSRD